MIKVGIIIIRVRSLCRVCDVMPCMALRAADKTPSMAFDKWLEKLCRRRNRLMNFLMF